jgi:pimeloyl-ACP methyl ester carboxylesterase
MNVDEKSVQASGPRRSKRGLILTAAAGGSALAGWGLARRYRRDMRAARARLASLDRRAVRTEWGMVEYAERGSGEPVLVVHGIFQGCDGGLLAARDMWSGRRVIAPSRFGYLGSSMPPEATPAAQADALAGLLDALRIDEIDVIGLSAGSTSVLQLALRHPERVRHLAVISGNLPGGRTAVVQPAWARRLYGDLPLWTLKTFAPHTMAYLAGIPKTYRMTADEALFVKALIDSMFPISAKFRGVVFDAFVSNADVNGCTLEAITVQTLLFHAKDDPLASYEAAERAAARIPGARLISLDTGGHLLMGQGENVQRELADFLAYRAAA